MDINNTAPRQHANRDLLQLPYRLQLVWNISLSTGSIYIVQYLTVSRRVQRKKHICIFIRPSGLLKTASQSFAEWATCCYLLYSKAANTGPQNCLHFRNTHCTHDCLNSSPVPHGLLISDLT